MAALLRVALLRNIRFPPVQTLTLTLTLNGRRRRSSSSFVRRMSTTEDQIMSTAMDVIQGNPNIDSLKRAIDIIEDHPKVKLYPKLFKDLVFSRVIDVLKNYPQINPYEVFLCSTVNRFELSHGDFADDLTKEQVTSRVVKVIKMFPEVCPSKVTEEADFHKDLGLGDPIHRSMVISGLQMEFKLYIPWEERVKIGSCKDAIDYIYNHRKERLPREEFLKKIYTNLMLRHLRVPASQTLTLNLNGRKFSCSSSRSTEDQAMSTALDILQSNPNNKSVYRAVDLIKAHPKVQISPRVFRYHVMSRVLDFMENDPKVDPYMVYGYRSSIRLYTSQGDEDLTKDQIISIVLDIVKTHPKVCPSKVTEEAHFYKDLGLDSEDCMEIILVLQVEFKLCIPEEEVGKIETCKYAIDYIYNHLGERLPRKEFIMKVFYAPHLPPPMDDMELENNIW